MSLIVEDGTMPPGANSYASVEDADAYLVPRGVSGWPSPSDPPDPNLAAKEAALIRASDWLNTLLWKGERIDPLWTMAWPRAGVPLSKRDINGVMQFVPHNVVPVAVQRACIELAALIFAGENPLEPVERGGRVASETVGPISTSYFNDAPSQTLYPAVSGLIGAFLSEIPGKESKLSGCVQVGRG